MRTSREAASKLVCANTNPRIAKMIARNVEIDTKRDGERAGSVMTNKYDPRDLIQVTEGIIGRKVVILSEKKHENNDMTLVPEKFLFCHMRVLIIHTGRYAREILKCQDLLGDNS